MPPSEVNPSEANTSDIDRADREANRHLRLALDLLRDAQLVAGRSARDRQRSIAITELEGSLLRLNAGDIL